MVHSFYGLICKLSDNRLVLKNPLGFAYREENLRFVEQNNRSELPQSVFSEISALIASSDKVSQLVLKSDISNGDQNVWIS